MTNVLLIFASACALVYMPMAPKPVSTARTFFKTASVGTLAVIAVFSGAPLLLWTALALCAIGDALLSRETDQTFMAGIGAFAAGHLAYIALFLTHPSSDPALIWDQPAMFWSLVILGIIAATLLTPRAGDLKGPVLAYIPIILGMGIAVLSLPDTDALWLALPAALAFIASDLILATEKFLLPPNHPSRKLTPYPIWILYWGAQVGLLLAFV